MHIDQANEIFAWPIVPAVKTSLTVPNILLM